MSIPFFLFFQDINECLTSNGGCRPNARCVNLPGSAKCVCDEGYAEDGEGGSGGGGGVCRDVDECAQDPGVQRHEPFWAWVTMFFLPFF